jgi:ATP synthase mitochondrial F1 complex assembly factor 2
MMNRAASKLLQTNTTSFEASLLRRRTTAPSSSSSRGVLRRSFASNSKNVTAAAADRRLAGRRRFYKNVGIAPSTAPAGNIKRHESNKLTNGDNITVQSPISAGVDGTQSATGVNRTIKDSSKWASRLNTFNNSDNNKNEWYSVTLDGRAIRTPLGLPFSLPSPVLALAVAAEWDSQKTYLQPAQMPIMTLCCTAIDQVASDPTSHHTDIIRYLRNDTSCYWVDPTEDRLLHRRQSQAWDKLHKTVASELLGLPDDSGPAQAVGGSDALLLSRKSDGNQSFGLPHPPLLVEKAKKWVDSLDAWTLTALYSACAESKSFFIAAAMIYEASQHAKGERKAATRDPKWAVQAARVEEEFNIEMWGLVEGGHDYDRLNSSIQMHAASFLAQNVTASFHRHDDR